MTTATTAAAGNCRIRTYCRSNSAVFLKTREKYGGLSNMAGGFPLFVNDVPIRSSEALYQACRFPHLPEMQKLIIAQKSPMTAKMKGKPHRRNSRSDWDAVRVKIMRWCLEVKLAQNWDSFSGLLLETGDLPIVEHSRRDDFWGAKPVDDHTLIGINVLGRLLMQLRERVKQETPELLLRVEPLSIADFLLYECPIEPIGPPIADHHAVGSSIAEKSFDYAYGLESTPVPEQGAFANVLAGPDWKYASIPNSITLVDINSATVEDLKALPGLGPKLAQGIIDHRKQNGPFRSDNDITAVSGIAEKTYTRIATLITTDTHTIC